jgi:hypothetical protein
MASSMLASLQDQCEELNAIDRILLKAAIVTCLLGLCTSILIVWRMRERFLMEVYMLSLLSESMIAENKRIESYIDHLEKEAK